MVIRQLWMCSFRFTKIIPCILFTSMNVSCNFRLTKTVSSLILQMTDLTGNNYSLHMFFEHCFLIGSTRYFDPPLSIKAMPTHLSKTFNCRCVLWRTKSWPESSGRGTGDISRRYSFFGGNIPTAKRRYSSF